MAVVGQSVRPLRVVLLYSAGHLGSATIMNRLMGLSGIEIVGLVRSQPLRFTRQGARQIKKHLRKVGWRFGWLLFWQRCIQGLGFLLGRFLPGVRGQLKSGVALAREKGIPVFACADVNAPRCRTFIADCAPDLLISAYFSQILKKEVIGLARCGVLNVHPGWLPAYRGAMCYFWVLKNGEDRGGVSVHWIDEGIDTGAVVARRAFQLRPGWTQQRVLVYTAVIGACLLRRVIRGLQRGESPVAFRPPEGDARYYPMPGQSEFEEYFAKRRFFRIRDVLGYLWRPAAKRKA